MTGWYVAVVACSVAALALVAWRESKAEERRQLDRMYRGRQVTETWSRTETTFPLPERRLDESLIPVTDAEWRAAFERLVGPEEAK